MIQNHPCYGGDRRKYARVHLPVAPACNLGCNYCNRKYDCVNESRPGVTSAVLEPYEALLRFIYFRETMGNVTVAGIAGPGDPFANPERTKKTLALINKVYPDVHLCLSTNGTLIDENLGWISSVGVKYVTVTVNAVVPEIAKKVYSFLLKGRRVLRGEEMAETIVSSQLSGIKKLSSLGISVKVNTVYIPGINNSHVADVALKVFEHGATIFNLIPFIPVKGSLFWNSGLRKAPESSEIAEIREKLRSMGVLLLEGCGRCRADAAGIIGDRRRECPFIAVASSNGKEVDFHFGSLKRVLLFDRKTGDFLGERKVKIPYNSVFMNDFEVAIDTFRAIKDCGTVVVKEIGIYPERILKSVGVEVVKTDMAVEKIVELLVLRNQLAGRC
ncbi:radical SAM protein [Desulfurobacterium sp.]